MLYYTEGMTWQPSTLTREQLEERRLAGAKLLRAGRLSHAEIARRLGVSRAAIGQWAARLQAGGVHALRRRRATGRPPKLTAVQQQALIGELQADATAAGFPTARWTLPRVRALIQRRFGVQYHPKHLPRLLRRLGFSRQVPLPRARERDEALIRAWLAHDWPRIKKSAAARRRHRVLR